MGPTTIAKAKEARQAFDARRAAARPKKRAPKAPRERRRLLPLGK